MKITTLPATIALAVGVALAGAAYASDAPTFDELDANKDGKISKEEAAEVTNLDFAAADQDKDGMLTREEYEAAIG